MITSPLSTVSCYWCIYRVGFWMIQMTVEIREERRKRTCPVLPHQMIFPLSFYRGTVFLLIHLFFHVQMSRNRFLQTTSCWIHRKVMLCNAEPVFKTGSPKLYMREKYLACRFWNKGTLSPPLCPKTSFVFKVIKNNSQKDHCHLLQWHQNYSGKCNEII